MLPKGFALNPAEGQNRNSFLPESQAEFYCLGQPQHYPAKVTLFTQDSPVNDVFVLHRGLVKLTRVEEDGQEMIVGLRSPTWILGAVSLITYQAHVVTGVSVTDCNLQRVSAESFLHMFRSNAQLSWSLHRMHCAEIREQFVRMSELGCKSAQHRLEQLLRQLALTLKATNPKEGESVKLPLKHWEIAQLIAVTPEHLSRLLKKMQQDGVIRAENGSLVMVSRPPGRRPGPRAA